MIRAMLLAAGFGLVATPAAALVSPTAETTQALATSASAQSEGFLPNDTVPALDLTRYAGTWYEVAAFPMRFQKNCVGTVVQYTLLPNGKVKIYNACRKNTLDGSLSDVTGTAWVPQREHPARLKVQFFWPFSGDYWVSELGKDYEYAVVGSPDQKFLWILSRERTMAPELYQALVDRARRRGYDVSKLKKTLQAE